MNINYDSNNKNQPSKIILARPGEKKMCILNSVQENTVECSLKLKDLSTLTFDLNEYVYDPYSCEMVKANGYDEIDISSEICVAHIGWFRVDKPPEITNNGIYERKSVSAQSIEVELQNKQLYTLVFNKGTTISQEMLIEDNVENFVPKRMISLYADDDPRFSMLDIILEDTYWTVGHVDSDIKNKIEPIEIDNSNVYSVLMNEVSSAFECVVQFDLLNFTVNVYSLNTMNVLNQGMFKDTNVIIGFRNVQNELVRSSDSEIYTSYRVATNDELLDISLVNYGSNYIENLSYFTNNKYMTPSLIEKYTNWKNYYDSHRTEYKNASLQYTQQQEIVDDLLNRVPSDGTQTEWQENFDEEELIASYKNYVALIRTYRSVYAVTGDTNFLDGEIKNHSSDYYSYVMTMNYILPNIIHVIKEKYATYYDHYLQCIDKYGSISAAKNGSSEDAYQFNIEHTFFQKVNSILYKDDNAFDSGTVGLKSRADKLLFIKSYVQEQYAQYYAFNIGCRKKYVNAQNKFDSEALKASEDWDLYQEYHKYIARINSAYNLPSGYDDNNTNTEKEQFIAAQAFDYDLYKTNYDLYGTIELQTIVDSFSSQINALKEAGYDKTWEEFSKTSSVKKEKYTTQTGLLKDLRVKLKLAKTALSTRKSEYNSANATLETYASQLQTLKDNVSKTNSQFGFTEDDFKVLFKLINEVDYVDEYSTMDAIYTFEAKVEKEEEIYTKAMDELYIYSQPQYTYSSTMDNILAISDYKELHEDINVGNFIHVMTDDYHQVKLRIMEITFNPLLWDNSLSLTFSNMIKSKNGYSDKISILDIGSSASKSSISSGSSSSAGANVTQEMLTAIFSSSQARNFSNGITNSVGDIAADSISAGTITTEELKVKLAQVDTLEANSAFVKYLESNLIVSQDIKAENLEAHIAEIRELIFDNATGGTITVEELKAKLAQIDNLEADSAFINYLKTAVVVAQDIKAENLEANIAEIQSLLFGSATGDVIQSTFSNAIISQVSNAQIKDAMIENISASKINAGKIYTSLVDIVGDEDEHLTIKDNTIQITDDNNVVRVQIGKDASDEYSMYVWDEDGNLMFDASGLTEDGITRPIIRNDVVATDANISAEKLNITSLFTALNEDGSNSLNSSKIFLDSTNQTLDVAFTSMKTGLETVTTQIEKTITNVDVEYAVSTSSSEIPVKGWDTNSPTRTRGLYIWQRTITTYSDNTTEVSEPTCINGIDGENSFNIVIRSSNGNQFKNGEIAATLTCYVFDGTTDVTDKINASAFHWKKINNNGTYDTEWNQNHFGGTKSINITNSDVYVRATFTCEIDDSALQNIEKIDTSPTLDSLILDAAILGGEQT